ncbi:MAG: methionyl-tRNA formyltransferase [Deltaproteobacteria bacterium]|nr:methionyl-tRNA formyltransferase [Deltaproteobacteria bacterium]
MRLVFLGSPLIAVASLKALLEAGHEILAVVTQPDKAKGRGKQLAATAVKEAALSLGLPVLQPESAKDPDFLIQLKNLQADYFVVVAYGKILSKAFLEIAPAINLHFSLLPKYRGAACVAQALIDGQEETGVTTMLIVEALDAGPILLQWTEEIKESDTVLTLSERLSHLGAEALVKTLEGLERANLRPVPQNDKEASYAAKIKKEQGHVDWSKSPQEIYQLYQGLSPWPGLYSFLQGKRLILAKLQKSDLVKDLKPGELFIHQDHLYVQANGGSLEIIELKPEGKKLLKARDFVKGYGSTLGNILE